MLLNITSLTKTYHSGEETISVLQNIDFFLENNQKASIMGSSGTGKSTLLNLIASIDKPTSGKIEVEGKDISSFKENELNEYRNKTIGLIFQSHYLIDDFTVCQNIYFPAIISGVKKNIAIEKAKELLFEIGLDSKANKYPLLLSGGERQRVAFLRAIINNPKLLLADEPTGNLDSKNRDLLIDIIFKMCSKYKSSLILVTHDKEIFSMTEKRYTLLEGKLNLQN